MKNRRSSSFLKPPLLSHLLHKNEKAIDWEVKCAASNEIPSEKSFKVSIIIWEMEQRARAMR